MAKKKLIQGGEATEPSASSPQLPAGASAPTATAAVALEIPDTEFDESAFQALLDTLDAGLRRAATDPEADPTPSYKAVKTVAEQLQMESRARDGIWTKWADVEDGEVLVCSLIYAIQEERKLIAQFRSGRKGGKATDPVPVAVELALQARARFGRAVKGWRGSSFEGFDFNFDNFLRMWTDSIAFRGFVNGEGMAVRARVEQELADQGKG